MDLEPGVPEIAAAFGMGRASACLRRAIAGGAPTDEDGTAGDAVPSGVPVQGAAAEAMSADCGPALTPEHAAALRAILLGERTEAAGTAAARRPWTTEDVRDLLAREFGVRTTADGAHAALGTLGLWPDRPPRRPHHATDAAWAATELPRIRERAAAEGARLYLVEDTLVGDGTLWLFTASPMYGPRRFALYDPAREGGDDHHRFLADFLERLARRPGPPAHVVLEPLPAEDARAVTALADASQGRLRVHFLPDALLRLERLTALWRASHEATDRRARERDEAARVHRDAKAAEERLRLERDRAIRGCRDAGIPVAELVEHTGLAPKTIYDALDRTTAPGPDEEAGAAPVTLRRQRLARLDAAFAAWRRAADAVREHAREREEVVAAYRTARAVEERLRRRRDDAIAAWRATGVAATAIAARTGLSIGLISQIAGRRPAAEAAARHGVANRLLAELERAGARWREATAATEERARARREAVDACRAARAAEQRLRARRDRVMLACQAAGIPAPDIALCAGLDVSTVYQTLRVHRIEPRDLPRVDRVRLMSRLREVSRRWRRAADAVRESVRLRDEAIRAWRASRADEEAARRERDRAIAECRAAGIGVNVLAACTRLDLSTVYGVCQAAGA